MGGSSSSSKADTSSYDNRKVLNTGAIDAAGMNGNISIQTLDGGAIKSAFGFGANALDFAGNAGFKVLDLTKALSNAAFASNADTINAALSANKYAQQQAYNTVSDSLSFAQSAGASAQATQRAALDIVSSGTAQALDFGAKQTSVALDSLNNSANLVKNAYADAKGRGAMTDYVLMAAMGVAAIVAVASLKK